MLAPAASYGGLSHSETPKLQELKMIKFKNGDRKTLRIHKYLQQLNPPLSELNGMDEKFCCDGNMI